MSRKAAIHDIKMMHDVLMTAFGKLHRNDSDLSQGPVGAESDDVIWAHPARCCEAENGRQEPKLLQTNTSPLNAFYSTAHSVTAFNLVVPLPNVLPIFSAHPAHWARYILRG
jgi:hypothetical protein